MQQLAAQWPSQHFTAHVYDTRSGCEYSLNPSLRLGTASVLKVEVMAGILLRAQNEGRPLTQWERDQIWPMITQSDNHAATELWQSLGGGQGMADLDGIFGLTETTPADPTWGNTSTSARDQVWLLRQVLLGQFGPMQRPALEEAWAPMLSVVPEQRWGITAGVPAGWPVAQKNGFAGSQCCWWRINSTGVVVDPGGGAYAVAILSDGWPSMEAGIPGVEYVSRAIAAPDELVSGMRPRRRTTGTATVAPIRSSSATESARSNNTGTGPRRPLATSKTSGADAPAAATRCSPATSTAMVGPTSSRCVRIATATSSGGPNAAATAARCTPCLAG